MMALRQRISKLDRGRVMGLHSASMNPHIESKPIPPSKKAENDIAQRKLKPQARKKRLRKKGEPQKEGKDGMLRLQGETRNTVTIPADERSSADK